MSDPSDLGADFTLGACYGGPIIPLEEPDGWMAQCVRCGAEVPFGTMQMRPTGFMAVCKMKDQLLMAAEDEQSAKLIADRITHELVQEREEVRRLREVIRLMDQALSLCAGQAGTPVAAEGCRLIIETCDRTRRAVAKALENTDGNT
jgi:hypothetical protein